MKSPPVSATGRNIERMCGGVETGLTFSDHLHVLRFRGTAVTVSPIDVFSLAQMELHQLSWRNASFSSLLSPLSFYYLLNFLRFLSLSHLFQTLTCINVDCIWMSEFQRTLQSLKIDKVCRIYGLCHSKHIVSHCSAEIGSHDYHMIIT